MATKRFNNQYDQQAADFCEKYGVVIEKKFVRVVKGFPNHPDDKMEHMKFDVKLYRKDNPEKCMEFPFYGSQHDLDEYNLAKRMGKRVYHTLRDYDILASIACETYCPDTIEEFIDEYGYEIKRGGDLSRVTNIFNDCRKMHDDLHRIFTDKELEALCEIQ